MHNMEGSANNSIWVIIMLYRRFALITAFIALLGLLLVGLLQSTRSSPLNFTVEERLDAWKRHNVALVTPELDTRISQIGTRGVE